VGADPLLDLLLAYSALALILSCVLEGSKIGVS